MIEWVTFAKRTDDPKLAWVEKLLDVRGIPHRRNGESWHAPILEVPTEFKEQAYEILLEDYSDDETPLLFDDIEDDDPMFDEPPAGWYELQQEAASDQEEDEEEEPFDPVRDGWVGSDGRP